MKDFIEQRIISAVRELLTEMVNELLGDSEFVIPLVEFGNYCGGSAVVPVIALSTCERSEKERIIRLDAYFLTITFTLPETPESELHCYAYSAAVSMAFYDNPTLGGIVDRAVVTGKKYLSPKKQHCGEGWGVVVCLRVTIEQGAKSN
jgi:hypothetical protein